MITNSNRAYFAKVLGCGVQEESIKATLALPTRAFLSGSPHPLLIFLKIYRTRERSQNATGWTGHLISQFAMSNRPILLGSTGTVIRNRNA